MGVPVGNQLGDEGGGIGVIVRLVIRDAGDGDHIIARLLRLRFGQAGASGVQISCQFHHAGAQAAAVDNILPGQIPGKAASRNIGGGAHGGPLCFSGDAVVHLRAVAHGVHVA